MAAKAAKAPGKGAAAAARAGAMPAAEEGAAPEAAPKAAAKAAARPATKAPAKSPAGFEESRSRKPDMNLAKKFSLSGGGYCVYAPRFPHFQTAPGFVDEISIFNGRVQPLFMLSFVENHQAVPVHCTSLTLKGGAAILEHTDGRGLKVTETRFVTADDRFVSQLALQNDSKTDRAITVVQWTWTDVEGEPPSLEGDSFRVRRPLSSGDHAPIPSEIVWSSPDSKGARCLLGHYSESSGDRPDFETTPWYDVGEFKTPRSKHQMSRANPLVPHARIYLGLFRPIELKAGGRAEHRFEANVIFKAKGLNYRPRRPDPKDENSWHAFSEKTPRFTSEWKALERVVRHRFELLHVLRIPQGLGHIVAPSVCEGTGPYHEPIAFSAPAAMREARWLNDPALARGVLRSFMENVKPSGQVPGRLHPTSLAAPDFYHADWGGAFEAIDAIHPDRATKKAVLMHMQRYVKWLANNRDPEGSGLTDIVNHFEAGQEFSRRYQVIDEKADRGEGFEEQFRLKGIDVSFFRYRLVKYLAAVADELQEKAMANRFNADKEQILDMIRKRMWDDRAGMFMDVDPVTRKRTGVKSVVGFYPLASDIATPPMVEAMLNTLGDRHEFWTKYPVPSLPLSDPLFNADGYWKGTRRSCPWNGRVWPTANSHVLEGLAYVAERGNKKAQKLAGELVKKTVTMLSGELEGVAEANACEHYHPLTGLPSRFRGYDQRLHSFLLDNVFRVACGFAIRFGEIQDDPIIEDPADFKLVGLPLGNKRFVVERRNGKLRVTPE